MLPVQQMMLGSGANHPATNTAYPDTGPGWSMAAGSIQFNNNRVYIPNDGDFAVGAGDFSVEWWQWIDPASRGNMRVWEIGDWPATNFGVSIEGSGNNKNFYLWANHSIVLNFPLPAAIMKTFYNHWHHFVIERHAGYTYLYIDGVHWIDTTNSYVITDTTTPLYLGGESSGDGSMVGNIADFRFMNGNYVFIGENNTAPSSPRDNTSPYVRPYTKLLLNGLTSDTAFVDSSTGNKTVTSTGATWSPRGPYLAPNLWLDGSADSWSGGITWLNLGRDDFNATLYSQMGVIDGGMDFNDYWGEQSAFAQLSGGTHPILANLSNGITVVALYDMMSPNNWERIIDFGNGQQNKNIILSRHGSSDTINWDIYGGSSDIHFNPSNTLAASGKHLVVTYASANGTGIVSLSGTVTAGGTTIPKGPRSNSYIGRSNWAGDQLLHGKIYHLSVFDRVLSADEIANVQSVLNYKYIPPTLLLNLDAGDINSYPGTGTTWTDTVSNIAFTLTNGPTYSSDNGGYIAFNPAAQNYAVSSTGLTNLRTWTVETWHYYDGTNTGSMPCIVTETFVGNGINYVLGATEGGASTLQTGFFNNGAWQITPSGYTLTAGNWYHIVGVYDGFKVNLYVNGILVETRHSVGTDAISSGYGIRLMARWDNSNYWGGRLAVVRIYYGAMNSDDIVTNFNAGKGRFI